MSEAKQAAKKNKAERARLRAMEAGEYLERALDSFPFASNEDKTAGMAAVISALVVRSTEATPAIGATSPTAGTGKTKFASVISKLATGEEPAVMSLGSDDNEFSKRLTGMILAGYQIIVIDNVERYVAGDFICQVTTSGKVGVRRLGVSDITEVPCRSLLIITGNNVTIKGDLTRRTLKVHLDARTERPERRHFERDVIEDVEADRRNLVEAALTIARAYHIAGCPAVPDLDPMGSFEDWDRLVRRPLAWAGFGDPLAPSIATREDDPDRTDMRALFAAWWDRYGSDSVTAAQLAEDALESTPRFDGKGSDLDHADLHDAVAQILGTKITARALGYVLRRYRDRIADGLKLEHAGTTGRNKAAAWKLVQL